MIPYDENLDKTTEYRRKLGIKIKILRELSGLNQADLADKLGYNSDTYICAVEKGAKGVKMEKIKELAAIFGVSVDMLLDDNDFTKEEMVIYRRFYESLKEAKTNPEKAAMVKAAYKLLK